LTASSVTQLCEIRGKGGAIQFRVSTIEKCKSEKITYTSEQLTDEYPTTTALLLVDM